IMAEAYQMMNQPEKAVSSYKEVLRHTPDNPTALTNKAVLDFKANRLKEAEKQTDKALEIHPEQISLHLLRAKIFEERGETTKAQAAIKVFRDETREKAKRDSSIDSIPISRIPKKSK
ncbi:MAG: tetratricopeptide repeat protein, partial [Haliscomenobacter sp.]